MVHKMCIIHWFTTNNVLLRCFKFLEYHSMSMIYVHEYKQGLLIISNENETT